MVRKQINQNNNNNNKTLICINVGYIPGLSLDSRAVQLEEGSMCLQSFNSSVLSGTKTSYLVYCNYRIQ